MLEEYSDDSEEQLEDIYVLLFIPLGYSEEGARAEVRKLIAQCKAEAKADGWDKVPDKFGDWLLEHAQFRHPFFSNIVEKAKKEGAREDDIRSYWNMKEWERRLIVFCDNYFRNAAYFKFRDEALSEELAVKKLNKGYPSYGDPDDTSICSGQDRPLPFEIKDRVNSYMMDLRSSTSLGEIESKLSNYSSMNAFLRDAIKKGLL